MKKYYLGIDGGGTKTTAVCSDSQGRTLARTVGDSISKYSVGLDGARQNLKKILDEISNECGASHFEAAVIGLASLSEKATEKETEEITGGILDAGRIYIDSDLFIALESVDCEGPCAVVISGTGSMAAARLQSGEIIHSGGWGYILGDEGSGYSIGLNGIKAAIAFSEGRGGSGKILEKCLEYFSIGSVSQLIDVFYDSGIDRKKTALFGKEICILAEKGDTACLIILESEAKKLCETALCSIKQLPAGSKIGLYGGVFENSPVFTGFFKKEMSKAGCENIALLENPPVYGAVQSAIKLSDTEAQKSLYKS